MSYLGVKFNNTIRKIAGMAIMDVAFSNTSTNGVQNKVIKAKFDEINSDLSYSNNETVCGSYGNKTVYRKILESDVNFPINTISTHLFTDNISEYTQVIKLDYICRQSDGSYVHGAYEDNSAANLTFAFVNSAGIVGITHKATAEVVNHVSIIIEYLKD